MADDTSPGGAPIEALLHERARFQQWLAKLDSAAGNAPPAVRAKVRADYQGRLHAVIDELKSHAETIRSALDRHRESQRDLSGRQSEAQESLAEAEVRHVVGEYADADWERMRGEATHTIEALQTELEKIGTEIDRLVEVQGFIAEPDEPAQPEAEPETPAEPEPVPIAELEAPRAPPPIEMLPDPTPDIAAAAGSPPRLDQIPDLTVVPGGGGAPRFVPKPAAEGGRGRPPVAAPAASGPKVVHGDELAFLKSVSGDDRKTGPRRSGETARPEAPAEPVATAAPQPSVKPGQASQAKTLKCGECGTLNRPTEWYCERCGAELAAL
ncbi:MAG TPA: hypothetical protein VK688_03635 [Gemmatimonadales bacterium]|nr:hypothetical protein [Gemmatimonadales bacterium]